MVENSINFDSGLSNQKIQIVPIANTGIRSDASFSSPNSLGNLGSMEDISFFDIILTPTMDFINIDGFGKSGSIALYRKTSAMGILGMEILFDAYDQQDQFLGNMLYGVIGRSDAGFTAWDTVINPNFTPYNGVKRIRVLVKISIFANTTIARWWWDNLVFTGKEVESSQSPKHKPGARRSKRKGQCEPGLPTFSDCSDLDVANISHLFPYSCNAIRLGDGTKVLSEPDLAVQSPAGALELVRSYVQDEQADSDFQFMGLGWLHNHFMKVSVTGTSPNRVAVVRLPDGGTVELNEDTTDHYVAAPGSTAVLDYEGTPDEYTLSAQHGSRYLLDGATGLIKSRHFAGGEVWTYTYSSGRLSEVADDYGRKLLFSYINNPSQYDDGQLWRVGDQDASGLDSGSPGGRYVEFSYTPEKSDGSPVTNAKALLASVQDVRGNTWSYDYFGQHSGETDADQLNWLTKRLSPSVDADGDGSADGAITLEELDYTLDGNGVITDINQKRGNALIETDFAIQPSGATTTTETMAGKTTTHRFADESGSSGVYLGTDNAASEGGTQDLLASYRPYRREDANGNETFMYWGIGNDLPERVVDALGNETQFVYNDDDTLDNSLDADGRKTVYTYEDIERAVNGGMELTTNWTDINGATSNRSMGQVDSGTYSRYVETSGAGEGIEGETWDLIAGRAYSISARVYVVAGSVKMQVTGTDDFDDVSTGTGSWQTLSASLIPTVSQPARRLQFVANESDSDFYVDTVSILETAREPIARKIYDDEAETTLLRQDEFVYDTKRRVTSEKQIDPSNGTTVLHEVTRTYYSSGDGEGLLHTVTQEDIGGSDDQTTTYTYDSVGRVIQVNQNSSFGSCSISRSIYDAAGNVVASICNYDAEADGVTSFDNNNPPQDAADAALLSQETTDPDVNRATTHEYDAMGRRVKTTTDAGASYAQTSLTLYDSLSRIVRTISNFVDDSYAAPGDWVFESGVWKDGPSGTAIDHGSQNNQNIVSDTDYNERGLVRLSRDALGNVTLLGYDDGDRLVKTVRQAATPGYNNDYSSGDPDLSAYSASSNADEDLITISEYDANGNLVKAVDLLGNTTLTGYDALNRVVKTVRNTSDPDYDMDADPDLSAYVANSEPDQDMVTETEYDAMGRVIRSTDTLGNVTLFGYDELGRQVKTIRSASDPDYDIASDPDLSAYTPSSNADEDIISQSVYADDGRVQSALDVLATATRFVYDGLGRQTRTVANYVSNGEDPAAWVWDGGQTRWEESDGTEIDHDTGSDTDANDQNIIAETVYDSDGRVESTRDVEGKVTRFVYDEVGRRTRTIRNYVAQGATDPADWEWVTSQWEDGASNAIGHGTDNDENIIGDTIYDARGRVQQTRDQRGNLSYFVYDTVGRRIRSISNFVDDSYATPDDWVFESGVWKDGPSGTAIDHGTDNDQNIISETVYDLVGRVVSTFDAAHNETRFVYDDLGRRIRSIQNYVSNGEDPSLWVWDETVGQKRWEESDGTAINHGADNDQNLISETVYNQAGQIVSTRDVRGTVTAFSYDLAGRRQSTTRAQGSGLEIISSVDYDKAGRVLGRSNGPGHYMVFQLDKLGRVTQVTDAEGNIASTVYAKDGRVISTTDPEGSVTQNRYDSLRRLRRVVQGFVDNGEDPALWVWDGVGEHWEESDTTPIDHGSDNDRNIIVDVVLDIMGRRTSQRDPRGYLTSYQYDQLGRRLGITNPLSQTWDTAYVNLSGGGSKVTLSDPLTHDTERVFDRLGRLKEISYNHASTPDVTFAYDLRGNRLSMSEDDGSLVRETFYSYDDARRLTQVDFDTDGDTVVEQTVSYEYDAGGLRTKMTLPGSLEIVYQYDAQGRLISLEDWDNQQSDYSYDEAGRLRSVRRPNGLGSRYDYDRNGRLLDLNHVDDDGASLRRFRYSLDGRGNRVQMQEVEPGSSGGETIAADDERILYLKGTWATEGAYEASDDFSARFRLNFWGDQAIITFGNDSDGGIVDIYADQNYWGSIDTYAASAGDETVTIDFYKDTFHKLEVRNRTDRNPASSGRKLRLKQIQVSTELALQTIQYAYDALARLQAADYYEGDDLSATPTRQYAYDYDPAGNRTQQVVTVSGSPTTTNYTYNAANQLTGDGALTYSYDANGNLTSDGTNTRTWDRANRLLSFGGSSYAYNGLGQRVSQEVSSVVTEYLLDMQPGLWKVVAADDGTDVNRYIHDPVTDRILQHKDPTGGWNWPALDGLGTVRGVYDDTLAEVYAVDRDPYGDLIASTGNNPTPFEYTGEPEDQNGLLHLRARYYDPSLAAFNSLDPLETPNRYAYVGGNPANAADPTGLFLETPEGIGGTCQDFQTGCSGDCLQVSTGCLHTPSTDLALFSQYGVSLTVECELGRAGTRWTPYIAGVRTGLEETNTALGGIGFSVKSAFTTLSRPLEFRIVSSGVGGAGRTINSSRVHWSTSGMDAEVDIGRLNQVVTHELGHVLENRRGLKAVAEVGDARNRWIPDRFDVASDAIEPVGGTAGEFADEEIDETKERIADYFLFWVHQGFNDTLEADVAQAFLEGNKVVLWQRTTNNYRLIDPGDDVSAAVQSLTAGEGCTFDAAQISSFSQGNPIVLNEGFGNSCEVAVIQTEGLTTWLTP
jgi:RHS repeat-associated protein